MTLGLSTNQNLVSLPAIDGATFVDGIEPAWVAGNTLVIDFPFPAYPYNSGHWTEVVLPLFRTLADGRWAKHCVGEGAGRAIIGALCAVLCLQFGPFLCFGNSVAGQNCWYALFV